MVSGPCIHRGRGGVPPPPAGVPRGAPAPRGVPPSRGPVSRSRGLLAPRARGVPPPAGYRPLPPPPAQETYGEYVSRDAVVHKVYNFAGMIQTITLQLLESL